jgi:hypothetical protein
MDTFISWTLGLILAGLIFFLGGTFGANMALDECLKYNEHKLLNLEKKLIT